MADRPALQLDAVGLQIGGARILHDVTFQVATGEMVGVIGPNGAGKTTLFNIVSGVMIPTSGRVLLQGDDVTSRKVHQRARVGLGRTFQTSSVFPSLTARENVRLAAQAKLGGAVSPWRFPRAEDDAHGVADRCLAEVGLAHHAASVGELWDGVLGGTARISTVLAAQPADVRERVREAFAARVAPAGGPVTIEAAVTIGCATGAAG